MVKNLSASLKHSTQRSITIKDRVIICGDSETILDTLERENIDADYNCREGFCGVCRTKLVSGSIDYKVDPLAFIDDDEILTCCTVPTSNIEIKIDY